MLDLNWTWTEGEKTSYKEYYWISQQSWTVAADYLKLVNVKFTDDNYSVTGFVRENS